MVHGQVAHLTSQGGEGDTDINKRELIICQTGVSGSRHPAACVTTFEKELELFIGTNVIPWSNMVDG